MLRRICRLMAQSGLSAMSSYLSAFGAKRTWRDRRWHIDQSLMTHRCRNGPCTAREG